MEVAIPPVLHRDVATRVAELADEVLGLASPGVLPDVDRARPRPRRLHRAELREGAAARAVAALRIAVKREHTGEVGLLASRDGADDLVQVDVVVHVRSASAG